MSWWQFSLFNSLLGSTRLENREKPMTHPQPKLSLEEIKSNLEAIIINGTGPGEYGFDESGIAVTDECLEQILAFLESILPEINEVTLEREIGAEHYRYKTLEAIRGAGE